MCVSPWAGKSTGSRGKARGQKSARQVVASVAAQGTPHPLWAMPAGNAGPAGPALSPVPKGTRCCCSWLPVGKGQSRHLSRAGQMRNRTQGTEPRTSQHLPGSRAGTSGLTEAARAGWGVATRVTSLEGGRSQKLPLLCLSLARVPAVTVPGRSRPPPCTGASNDGQVLHKN